MEATSLAKRGKPEKKEDEKAVEEAAGIPLIHPSAGFDLEAYASRYSGFGKYQRLVYIGQRCPELQLAAFRAAVTDVKKVTLSPDLLADVVSSARECLGSALGDAYGLDEEWTRKVNRVFFDKMGRLENDLNVRSRENDKVKIRETLLATGHLFLERGDFTNAMSKYLEARDYSSSHADTLETCFHTARAGILGNSLTQAKNQVDRALMLSSELAKAPQIEAQLQAMSGLIELRRAGGQQGYSASVEAFLKTKFNLPQTITDLIAPVDIAIFCTLTALAHMDRPTLKKRILENETFRKFLELSPIMKKLALDFFHCQYSTVFQTLSSIESDLLLDMNLGPHVHKLIKKIREKGMIQYFSPYVSVKMADMAHAFNLEIAVLEKELASLIADNKIQARIDAHEKVLYAKNPDQRLNTYEKAINVSNAYIRDTRSLLLRMSLVKQNFVIRPKKRDRDAPESAPASGPFGLLQQFAGALAGQLPEAMRFEDKPRA